MNAHAYKHGENPNKDNRTIHKARPNPALTTKHVAPLETRLEGMRDGEARIARVEALKAQIEAGTYRVDSKAVAQKMLKTPLVQRVLGVSQSHVDELSLEEE